MENVIQRTLDFIKIPSVSGNKTEIRRILDLVKAEFAPLNFCVREYNFEGADPVLLLATHETDDFDILTVGHLDVVPASSPKLFEPEICDGRIYARGASDMKSQISVNLESLKYAAQNYPDLKFGVLITTDEETTSNGIRSLEKFENISAKIVLDNDSGNLNTLVEKYKHPVSVKLSAAGSAAHSSRPWLGSNAVVNLMACIQALQKHFPHFDMKDDAPEDTWINTMVVTAFNSPTTYNVVPAEAEARLNFRLIETMPLEDLCKILDDCSVTNSCRYEILLSSCGVYMDAECPEIKAYRQVAAQVLGYELVVSHSAGATDSRPFGKNSVVIMHSVDGGEAHGDGEYVEIDSVLKLAEIQRKFIDTFAAGKVKTS